jgi:hypothetical protein
MSTPQQTGNPLLEAAWAQARRGFRMYHARPGTKRPQWTGYKERATTDEAMLTAWWTRYPHANPMALIPPSVAIVDVDPRHGGQDGLRTLGRCSIAPCQEPGPSRPATGGHIATTSSQTTPSWRRAHTLPPAWTCWDHNAP